MNISYPVLYFVVNVFVWGGLTDENVVILSKGCVYICLEEKTFVNLDK